MSDSMTDFEGEFEVPSSLVVPGSWIVGGWSDVVISINKIPITSLQSFECIRDLNVGAGTCSLQISDPNRTLFDLYQAQDEIEIFAKDPISEFGRKIWGGYADDINYTMQGGQVLQISGKDYTSRLQSQTYNNASLSGSLYSCINTIMATQSDFTYEGVPASLLQTVAANISNDSIYNSIKQLTDQSKSYFVIDPETRDLTVWPTTTITYSPDALIEGTNILRQAKVKKNSEFLTNKLQVNYRTGTQTAYEDSDSQTNYGMFSRAFAVGNLGDTATAAAYQTTVVTAKKEPIEAYEIESSFLFFSDPGEYILTQSPTLNLDGAFQILKIGHNWSMNGGFKTKVLLNTQFVDTRIYMADLERRLRTAERKVFA